MDDQLAFGDLELAPRDADLAGKLGQGFSGPFIGQPLDVGDQDLRVTAETRMTHDVVRDLRVAPNRRDSMPKHPGGPLASTTG
ncbi:hypothetical protein ACIRP4_10785 [Streptomyces bacillaris]|uniref:hypothetical protein n=1 Tax=Streptomyces bacillaris TaxID=68179 RepID=UPI003807E038